MGDGEDAGVYPDETTGYDEVGPFLAVPHESEAENPKPAIAGWDNSTSLQAAAFHSWAAPSAKSTTLATSAMASLECAAASSNGASSNVAPQHMPVAVDTAVAHFQSQGQVQALPG